MGKLTSEELTKIRNAAEGYKDDMTRFLRAIVKNPGESAGEADHVATIKADTAMINAVMARLTG